MRNRTLLVLFAIMFCGVTMFAQGLTKATVNGKVVPVLYLQVHFQAQKGRSYPDKLFTFKVRGDQAPILLQ